MYRTPKKAGRRRRRLSPSITFIYFASPLPLSRIATTMPTQRCVRCADVVVVTCPVGGTGAIGCVACPAAVRPCGLFGLTLTKTSHWRRRRRSATVTSSSSSTPPVYPCPHHTHTRQCSHCPFTLPHAHSPCLSPHAPAAPHIFIHTGRRRRENRRVGPHGAILSVLSLRPTTTTIR